ncbi:hypothetical protein ACMFMF_004820 [Clarireedia jacksonii]
MAQEQVKETDGEEARRLDSSRRQTGHSEKVRVRVREHEHEQSMSMSMSMSMNPSMSMSPGRATPILPKAASARSDSKAEIKLE